MNYNTIHDLGIDVSQALALVLPQQALTDQELGDHSMNGLTNMNTVQCLCRLFFSELSDDEAATHYEEKLQ